MQHFALDFTVFQMLAAAYSPNPALLQVAIGWAHWSYWAMAAVLLACGYRQPRCASVIATSLLACVLSSLLARELREVLNMPRPFMLGLSPNYIDHSVRAGMPSAHASAFGAMLAVLWWHALKARSQITTHRWPSIPPMGAVTLLSAMALSSCWTRFYTGAHFPSDLILGLLFGGTFGFVVAQGMLGMRRAIAAMP